MCRGGYSTWRLNLLIFRPLDSKLSFDSSHPWCIFGHHSVGKSSPDIYKRHTHGDTKACSPILHVIWATGYLKKPGFAD